jgi:hypothetical protein
VGSLDIQTSFAAMRSGGVEQSSIVLVFLPRRSFGDETCKASWRPCHLLGRGSTPAGKMHGGEGVLGGVRASIESSCRKEGKEKMVQNSTTGTELVQGQGLRKEEKGKEQNRENGDNNVL